MKHDLLKTTFRLLLAAVMVYLLPGIAWGEDTPPLGDGSSAGNPYQISTRAHLEWMADQIANHSTTFDGKFFKLQNNIDLGDTPWTPIGLEDGGMNFNKFFAGTFDGGGYTISGLSIPTSVAGEDKGLFGQVGENGTIKNLGVEIAPEGICISNLRTINAGGIAGQAWQCTIENCYVTGGGIYCDGDFSETNKDFNIFMGSIAGNTQGSTTIRNCYATIDITTDFKNALATSNVAQAGIRIAGIAGGGGSITNCWYSGKLMAQVKSSNTETKCFAAGIAAWPANVSNCLVLSREIIASDESGQAEITKKAIAPSEGNTLTANYVSPLTTINGTAPNYDNAADGTKWTARTDGDAPISTWIGTSKWKANTNTRYMSELRQTDGSAFNTTPLSVLKQLVYISTATELADIDNDASSLAADYILANDIDLSTYNSGNWTSIGTESAPFLGTLDGNGYRITGLAIAEGGSTKDAGGLFGYVSQYGSYSGPEIVIKNLGVVIAGSGIHINTNIQNGGGIVSNCSKSKIQNCYVTGGMIYGVGNANSSGSIYIGGIAGRISADVSIEYCYSTIDMQGKWNNPRYGTSDENLCIGGIAGDISNGIVKNCFATGTISAILSNVTDNQFIARMGGIAAYNAGVSCTVENCLAANSGGLTIETAIPTSAWINNIIGDQGSFINLTTNYALNDIPKSAKTTSNRGSAGTDWDGLTYPAGIFDNDNWQISVNTSDRVFPKLCYAGTNRPMPNQPDVIRSFKVSATSSTNGSFSVDKSPWAKVGETVTITTTPDAGYTLDGLPVVTKEVTGGPISVSGSANSYTFEMVPEAVTVSASFIKVYTVTIDDAITNGSIEVRKNTDNSTLGAGDNTGIINGTELTITATPNNSYRLKQLTAGSNSSTQNPYTVTVADNITISAEFEPIPVTPPDPVEPDNPGGTDPDPEEPVEPDTPGGTDPEPVYYTVTLPIVEGATTDPVAGEYEVEALSSFRFYLTLDKDYDKSEPMVTTDRGETITPRTSDGAYIAKYIRQPVSILIDGIIKNPDPVGNETVTANQSKVWAAEGYLHIEAATDGQAYIFTADGRLLKLQPVTAGQAIALPLPEGVYLVRIGDERFKVLL